MVLPKYTLQLVWFHIRSHLTKALGTAGIVAGYAMETQALWASWLWEARRGVPTKYLGITVLILGLYNQLFPPTRPVPPFDPYLSSQKELP